VWPRLDEVICSVHAAADSRVVTDLGALSKKVLITRDVSSHMPDRGAYRS
jgi:hypothetical protein